MARYTLVYGIRLVPEGSLTSAGEAQLQLADGETAGLTLHTIDGTIPQLRRALDRSLDAFFEFLPGASDVDRDAYDDNWAGGAGGAAETPLNMVQAWNAHDYAANARFVSDLGQAVLDLLAPQPGERILDVGCGDGALTEKLAHAGAVVVGADPSAELIAAAVARGLDARRLDAQTLPFTNEFDAVFTNAALHWIPDIDAALRSIRRALRPGGRFVGEFGGHGCVAAVCTALQAAGRRRGVQVRMPWYFPTPDDFGARLVATGFRPVSVQLIPRPTPLPAGMGPWLRTFAGPVFEQLPEAEREPAFAEVLDLLRWSLCDAEGRWTADYTRLRFAAVVSEAANLGG